MQKKILSNCTIELKNCYSSIILLFCFDPVYKVIYQNKRSYKSLYFQGFFKNGEAYGHFWIQMEGGGHLHGKVNSEGLISGNNIAYIYPDGETALLGKFEDRVMIEARQH